MTLSITVAILVTSIISASLYTYRVIFYSSQIRSTHDSPLVGEQYEAVSEYIERISHVMEKAPCEAVTIISYDGCKLYGRYYHLHDGAPLEIMFHGYRSCAFRDCSGSHALSRKLGFNALVVDQRAHGKSDGTVITFGNKEHRDCLCWIEYANKRFGNHTPIVLFGLSMGAATVLMSTGLHLPTNVACIIADSPYSAPGAIIEKVCKDMRYPISLCMPFIRLGALLFGHFQLNASTASNAVKHSKIPILLIHGADDRLVPYKMSCEIAKNCRSRVELQVFPGAGHGLGYISDPLRYENIIYDFLMSVPSVGKKISEDFLKHIF